MVPCGPPDGPLETGEAILAQQRLSEIGVKAAKAKGPRTDIWDGGCPGLVLRVTDKGRKTWFLFYRHGGKKRRTALGSANDGGIGLADARKLARERRDMALAGDDPAAGGTSGRPRTVADLVARYAASAEAQRKRTWAEEQRLLAKDVLPRIGKTELDKLRKADVLAVVERITDRGSLRVADRAARILSAILNWGLDENLVNANPAQRIRRRAATNARERVMSRLELQTLLRRLSDVYPERALQLMMRLLLLTGCRKMEVQAARVDEFALATDNPVWVIPSSRTKNGRTHTLPLSGLALAVAKEAVALAGAGPLLFPAPLTGQVYDRGVLNKGLLRAFRAGLTIRPDADGISRRVPRGAILVPDREGKAPFTIHDVRRTVAVHLKEMGVSPDVRKAVLNHAPQGVTAIHYEGSADMLPQMRITLEALASRLEAIEKDEPGSNNVRFLRAAT